MCPFCVRVVYDRAVGGYVFKVYRLSHLGHAVNFSSIVGHIKFEADFIVSKTEEKRYNDVKKIFDSIYTLRKKNIINSSISCYA